MSQHSVEERVIALAALFQAVSLVQRVSREGHVDQALFKTTIESILITDAGNAADVYGGLTGVTNGLEIIGQLISNKSQLNMELIRYALNLMHLERKLSKQPKLLQKIGEGISAAQGQAEHFSTTHENVIARLAGLYSDTVSTIPPKIIIDGEQGYLSNPDNVNKVRALLLAGMRATILWRQCGGNRIQLLLQRKKLLATSSYLLNKINQEQP